MYLYYVIYTLNKSLNNYLKIKQLIVKLACDLKQISLYFFI